VSRGFLGAHVCEHRADTRIRCTADDVGPLAAHGAPIGERA
jgi:hypothetical protein